MRRTVGWPMLACGFLVWAGNGHAYGSGPVVINLQPPEFAPERTAAMEKAFPGAHVTVRREAAHRYRVDRMWLPDYADEYESEANLCLYFQTHEHVNLEATLSVQQCADKSTALTFKLLRMECPSGSKTSQTASFLPLELGFASLDLSSTIYQVSTLMFPGS